MVTNAVHWFRNWSLIMGRGGGATHCLYGFVHLHKLFMELEKGLDCQHTNSIMIQNTLNLMPCIPFLANPLVHPLTKEVHFKTAFVYVVPIASNSIGLHTVTPCL